MSRLQAKAEDLGMLFLFLLFFWIGSLSALIIAVSTNSHLKKELRELKDDLVEADRIHYILENKLLNLANTCTEQLQVINELKRKISNSTKGN